MHAWTGHYMRDNHIHAFWPAFVAGVPQPFWRTARYKSWRQWAQDDGFGVASSPKQNWKRNWIKFLEGLKPPPCGGEDAHTSHALFLYISLSQVHSYCTWNEVCRNCFACFLLYLIEFKTFGKCCGQLVACALNMCWCESVVPHTAIQSFKNLYMYSTCVNFDRLDCGPGNNETRNEYWDQQFWSFLMYMCMYVLVSVIQL